MALQKMNFCQVITLQKIRLEREKEGLREFAAEYGETVKELVILTKDFGQTDDEIYLIPLWKWLLGKR